MGSVLRYGAPVGCEGPTEAPPLKGFCVINFIFFPHLNRFNVFPLVCKTDWTQTPMAAASLAEGVFFTPGLSLIVFRTFLIQRQKSDASLFLRVAILLRHNLFLCLLRDGSGYI